MAEAYLSGIDRGLQSAAEKLEFNPKTAPVVYAFRSNLTQYPPVGDSIDTLREMLGSDPEVHEMQEADQFPYGALAGDLTASAAIARAPLGDEEPEPLNRPAVERIKDFARWLLDGLVDR